MPDPRGFRRARCARPAYRPRPGAERRVQLRDQPVQPRDTGETAARLVDQALCLSHRARARLYAFDRGRGWAGRDQPGRGHAALDAGQLQQQQVPRPDAAAPRARTVAQYGDSAPCRDGRDGGDRRDHREIRHHGPHAAALCDVARRRRDNAAQAHGGLCDARQWREAHHADPDRPRAGPRRQDDLQGRSAVLRRLHKHRVESSRPAGDPGHARADLRPGLDLPDGRDAGGGRAARHRHRGEARREAARRQDRDDQ